MPELAEVEYFRKRWDAGLGEKIVAVRLHGEKRIFRGADVRAIRRRLVRQTLVRSTARGKQMLFEFSGANWLGIHLGMSGNLRIEPAGFIPGKHDHLLLEQKSRTLVFRDPRQFGRVRFHHGKDKPAWWQTSGPEIHSPEFSQNVMREFVRHHQRAPIKAVLLLQNGFPGVGNWMADEILWRARIAPRTRAGKLSAAKLAAIWRSTRFVARASLITIGQNFSDPPKTWLLHERWKPGGKCPRHGTNLRRATIGGRTTAWCARCQK
ncbi:MAG TPA: DNA-formamidopyrimidine glycosylase family protein [Chthoniobacterales bacterium]|nr:DNA-formamidopyrimidine glycosylase family protein [Chthoniobacterales bacterium]